MIGGNACRYLILSRLSAELVAAYNSTVTEQIHGVVEGGSAHMKPVGIDCRIEGVDVKVPVHFGDFVENSKTLRSFS